MFSIDEITPELLKKLGDDADHAVRVMKSRLAAEELRQNLRRAREAFELAERLCQESAGHLRRQGMLVPEVAEWFGVTVSVVKRWGRAPIKLTVTPGVVERVRLAKIREEMEMGK